MSMDAIPESDRDAINVNNGGINNSRIPRNEDPDKVEEIPEAEEPVEDEQPNPIVPPLNLGIQADDDAPVPEGKIPKNEGGIIDIEEADLLTLAKTARASQKSHREKALANTAPKLSNLKDHIRDSHPATITGEKFGLCSSLGLMPVLECMSREPSELSQKLGVGPTLFLMSTRAMSWLFFFLTIINLPAFAYYYKGTSSDADGESTVNTATGFSDYFKLLSLGNVGQSSYSCGYSNFATI